MRILVLTVALLSCATAVAAQDDARKENVYERRDGGVWDACIRLTGVAKFYETVKGKPGPLSARAGYR